MNRPLLLLSPTVCLALLSLAACGSSSTTPAPAPASDSGAATDGGVPPHCTPSHPCTGATDAGGDTGALDGGGATSDGGAGSAGSFACGSALTCDGRAQVCKVGVGGVAGSQPSYSCQPIPATCASNVTCACIETAMGAQLCSEANGDVTVTFEYP